MSTKKYNSSITDCYFDNSLSRRMNSGDSINVAVTSGIPAHNGSPVFYQDPELLALGAIEVKMDKIALMTTEEYERLKLAAGEPVV